MPILIHDADPLEGVACEHDSITVSALQRGEEVLLLVSDYETASDATVKVTLPVAVEGTVWDLARKAIGGSIAGDVVTVRFSPGVAGAHCALYYIGPRVLFTAPTGSVPGG